MVDVEELRKKILERTGMSRAELDRLVEKKMREYAGLLTELGVLYTIAKEYGIEVDIDRSLGFRKKIGELRAGDKDVTVVGRVVRVFPPREFKRDGRKGRYVSLILSDGTGEIRLVLWNRDVDLVTSGKIKKGTVLEVINGKVEEFNGRLSLRLGYMGRLLIDPEVEEPLPEPRRYRVEELTPNLNDVDIELTVERVFDDKEVEARGEKIRYVAFLGRDDTGSVRVVLWGKDVELRRGDVVLIRGGYTREGRLGVEVHVGKGGSVEVRRLPYIRKRLAEVEEGDRIETVATVVAVLSSKPYSAVCRDCGSPAEWDGERWVCTSCGSTNVRVTPLLALRVDDGSSNLRAALIGAPALHFYGDSFPSGAEEKALSLLGRDVLLRGVVVKNEVASTLEIIVDELGDPNLPKEIHDLLQKVKERLGEREETRSREVFKEEEGR